jgi:predicted transcriptional regulator
MSDDETTAAIGAGPGTADFAELIKMLMQERDRREREVEHERKFMQEQMDSLMKLVREQAKSATTAKTVERDVKFSKFTEADDIEAYLTTFEQTMTAFKLPQEQWVYKLAPQLTGKAQKAFAAMETTGAGKYMDVKAAILQRYNINEETYRQRLRSIRPKEDETHQELAVRVQDLTRKYCKKVEEVLELIATEQLLEALPTNVRIWVRERKPKTATEAGQLADDYVQARRQEGKISAGTGKGGEPTRNPAKPQSATTAAR